MQATSLMATNKKKQRKCRLIAKKELTYLLSRLRTIDASIMRASVLKLVEELERNHIDFFQSRRATWDHWKSAESLDALLSFLLTGFCDLLQKHIVGGERFANFLVSWYNFVGSIAVHSLRTEKSSAVWRQIPELSGVCKEDRSALVHSVAKCVYAFLQKQVGSNWKAIAQCTIL